MACSNHAIRRPEKYNRVLRSLIFRTFTGRRPQELYILLGIITAERVINFTEGAVYKHNKAEKQNKTSEKSDMLAYI
jgi:hypothetical protein